VLSYPLHRVHVRSSAASHRSSIIFSTALMGQRNSSKALGKLSVLMLSKLVLYGTNRYVSFGFFSGRSKSIDFCIVTVCRWTLRTKGETHRKPHMVDSLRFVGLLCTSSTDGQPSIDVHGQLSLFIYLILSSIFRYPSPMYPIVLQTRAEIST
jgi:hypothetical protein